MSVASALSKAIAKQARKGAAGARVFRPGEKELLAQEAERVAAKNGVPPAADPVKTPPTNPIPEPEVPVAPVKTDPAAAKVDRAVAVKAPEPPASATKALDESTARVIDADAARMRAAKVADFFTDEGQHLNFDKVRSADDVKNVIAYMADKNKVRVNDARRNVITDSQMDKLADDLRTDAGTIAKILERESGGLLSPELLQASRELVNASAARLRDLAGKITTGNATDVERVDFVRQQQLHSAIYDQFMGSRAEWGRSGRVLNKPLNYTQGQLTMMRDLVDSVHGGVDIDRLAAAIVEAPDTGAITDMARKYSRATVLNTLNEVFINSILSWVKTPLINLFGNMLMPTMRMAETAVAARIGSGLAAAARTLISSEIGPAMRLGRFLGPEEHVRVGEAAAMLHGELSAVRDAWRLMGISFRRGASMDNIVKYDTGARKVIASHNLPPRLQDTLLGRFVDGLGAAIRFPTERMMVPPDEFFKTLAYRAELERMAFLHTYRQVASGATTVDDAMRVSRQFMEESPLRAVDAAEQYALEATFQVRLGPQGALAEKAIRSVPLLTLVAPFIRTPVNLFKEGILRRTPLAALLPEWRAAFARGGRDRDTALARITMASATAAWVAAEVANGNITGAGPTDPAARQILEATGWRPYSQRFRDLITNEDKYISYARAEPLSFAIGSIADATEIMSFINSDVETMDDEEEEMTNVVTAIVVGIANNTTSKTFTNGLVDLASSLSDPKRYAERAASNLAVAIVPFSSFRRGMAQMQDPYMREAWTLMDKMRVASGIPGYSEGAPPRRNIFGEPRKWAAGDLIGPMSPFPTSAADFDSVTMELAQLMQNTRRVPITLPSKRIEGMQLTVTEYDELIRYARLEPGADGLTFKERLAGAIESAAYLALPPDGQVDYLKFLQRQADAEGRDRLLYSGENVEVAERLTEYLDKRQLLKRGE